MFAKVKSLFVIGILAILMLSALPVGAQNGGILVVSGVDYDDANQCFNVELKVLRGVSYADSSRGFLVVADLQVDAQGGNDTLFRSDTYSMPITMRSLSEDPEGNQFAWRKMCFAWDRNGGLVSGEVVVQVSAELVNPAGQVVEATVADYIILLG